MSGAGKKVLVKTFGCQMNVYDSERMAEALSAEGYAETEVVEDADDELDDEDDDAYDEEDDD